MLRPEGSKKTTGRKKTGELELFKRIWANRPHYSQVSGKYLGPEMNVTFFAHIFPKSTRPEMRLDESNIMLMTFEEHFAFDNMGKENALELHPGLIKAYEEKGGN